MCMCMCVHLCAHVFIHVYGSVCTCVLSLWWLPVVPFSCKWYNLTLLYCCLNSIVWTHRSSPCICWWTSGRFRTAASVGSAAANTDVLIFPCCANLDSFESPARDHVAGSYGEFSLRKERPDWLCQFIPLPTHSWPTDQHKCFSKALSLFQMAIFLLQGRPLVSISSLASPLPHSRDFKTAQHSDITVTNKWDRRNNACLYSCSHTQNSVSSALCVSMHMCELDYLCVLDKLLFILLI